MFQGINSYEQEFAALVFTSLGEAKDISLEHRTYEFGDKRNHLEEMMAIMLVLENRRDKTNLKIIEQEALLQSIKEKYKGIPQKEIIYILKKKKLKIQKQARSLRKGQLHLRKGLRVSLIKLEQQIKLLKKFSSSPPRKSTP